jgi:hypothetical protein
MAAPKQVDYDRIEPDWRAGLKSIAQLAGEYTEDTGTPVSRAAIIKHFKNIGVARDLKAKIQAKAEAMVAAAMVTGKVTPETIATEKAIIDKGATEVAGVRISHRQDIARLRTLGITLLAELEGQSADPAMLAQLGELLAKPDDNGVDKLNDLYRKIISTPSRIDSAKKVAETLKHAIGLEREAYGLDEKASSKETSGEITISF